MTSRTAAAPLPARQSPLDRALSLRIAVNWELALYIAIFGVAFALRFWDLGSRALHHDESIHAQWSWDLLRGHYRHSPVFHGPLYYHVQALVFLIAGASDYTARVSAAIFGTALVALPLLLRRRFGTLGTMAAMSFIALSPTLVYFSRFFREDIYMALFTMLMVCAMWRYFDEGGTKWLVLLAVSFTCSVLVKEGAFISGAVFLVWLDIHLASELARSTLSRREEQVRATRLARQRELLLKAGVSDESELAKQLAAQPGIADFRMNTPGGRFVLTMAYAPFAWIVAALWPFLTTIRRNMDWPEKLPRSGDLLILLGTFTLPLLTPVSRHYLLEPLGLIETDRLSWELKLQGHIATRNLFALLGLFSVTTSIAAFAGLQWRPRLWGTLFLVCGALYLTLMTSFWTNSNGLVSGPWGSLDYWITQQDIGRGDQPGFYYFMLMPAYEFLTVALVIGGFWWATVKGDAFSRFLAFWLVGIWMALSIAAERMPWNNVHIALPAALLAAWIVARAFRAWTARPAFSQTRYALLSVAATAAGAMAIIAFLPGGAAMGAVRVLVAAVAVALIAYTARPWGRTAIPAIVVAAAIAAMAFFSVRTMISVTYQRGDVPKDMLVYTQSSPDIPKIAQDIDKLAAATGMGYELPIAVDSSDAYSMPWFWYLRDYKHVAYYDFGTSVPDGVKTGQFAVMLVNASNASKVNDVLASVGESKFGSPQKYPHRWWFDEGYGNAMSPGNNVACRYKPDHCGDVWDIQTWKSLADGIVHKGWLSTWALFLRDHDPDEILGVTGDERCNSCGSVDAWAYFPANFDRATGKISARPFEAARPTVDSAGRPMFGTVGPLAGQFFAPVDVETDPEGNLYVIDSSTKRLQKFDKDGNFLASADVRVVAGDLNEQSQPWGLAIAPNGNVVVADTFGWRVRVFDKDLKPTNVTFGTPPDTSKAPGPYDLFGPRDAIVDATGNIWVTDTGNSRIVIYTAAGEYVREIGTKGTGAGEFQEPVGLSQAKDGTIFVADMYNKRVVLLNANGEYQSSFEVEGWGGQEVIDKPYLEPLDDGRIAVSLPSVNQVKIFDRSGKLTGTIAPQNDPLSNPYGLAETTDGKLWVSEGGSSRLRLFDIP
ncbi:hypothetical protein AYO38_06550 [bacterium SCGC AG-212-C10]|nr:hypothetical protein AYO38_06550 [bacterium SCGC AG-212-C10]